MLGVVFFAASVLFAEPHPVPAVSNLVCDVRQAADLRETGLFDNQVSREILSR